MSKELNENMVIMSVLMGNQAQRYAVGKGSKDLTALKLLAPNPHYFRLSFTPNSRDTWFF